MTWGDADHKRRALLARLEERAEDDADIAEAIPWIEQFYWLSMYLGDDETCPGSCEGADDGFAKGIEVCINEVDKRFVMAAEGQI